jgi:hypothetical protein
VKVWFGMSGLVSFFNAISIFYLEKPFGFW